MNEILSEINLCKSQATDHSKIVQTLIKIRTNVNWQSLRPYTKINIENYFNKFWDFFIFSSKHQNTSVKLAAYRSVCEFMLKNAPFYPKYLQKTFIDFAKSFQADPNGSAIIIAAFSFLSNFMPQHRLHDFAEKIDIFKHFPVVDQMFSDKIPNVIHNLGKLGNDWLKKLLITYLESNIKQNDRYTILSIAEIMNHDPPFFYDIFLDFIRKKSEIEQNLGLFSFLISTVKCNFAKINIDDYVELSITILKNYERETSNNIDSAFQILSLDHAPFFLEFKINKLENGGSTILNVSVKLNDKVESFDLNVSHFQSRASFYLLPLPFELLDYRENDGILQLTSKFKTIAQIANNPRTTISEKIKIVEIFSKFLINSYNDMTSACMQGFALCLPSLLKLSGKCNIIVLIERTVFATQQSWFHSNDILSIIDAIPINYFRDRTFNTTKYIDILFEFSLSTNEKLSFSSQKVLLKIVNQQEFNIFSFYIAKKIDFFDISQLKHSLSLFTKIFESKFRHSKENHVHNVEIGHLIFLIHQIEEIYPTYSDDIEFLSIVLKFLSFFDLSLLNNSTLQFFISKAESITKNLLFIFTGLLRDNKNEDENEGDIVNFVTEQFNSLNFEQVPETPLNYEYFLPSYSSAINFLYSCPFNQNTRNNIINIFSNSMYLFPEFSAQVVKKHWYQYKDIRDRVGFLLRVLPTLDYIQNNKVIAIWCHLYLSVAETGFADTLIDFKSTLHTLCSKSLESNILPNKKKIYPEFYALEIYVANNKNQDEISYIKQKIDRLNELDRINVLKYVSSLSNKLLLKIGETRPLSPLPEIKKITKSNSLSNLNIYQSNTITSEKKLKIPHRPSILSFINSLDTQNIDFNDNELESKKRKLKKRKSNKIISSQRKLKTNRRKTAEGETDVLEVEELNHNLEDVYNKFTLNRIEQIRDDRKLLLNLNINKITKDLLETNLLDNTPRNILIKTQLKFNLYHFNQDQLQKIAAFYSFQNDSNGLIAITKYSKIHSMLISFKGLLFSDNNLPPLIKYLRYMKSDEFKSFIQLYQDISDNKATKIAILTSNITEFFNSLFQQQKISKKDILLLGMSAKKLFKTDFKYDQILDFIIKMISESKSKKRLEYVLTVANSIFAISPLSKQLIDKFISACSTKFNIIPGHILAQCVLTISSKAESMNNFKAFIHKCFSVCSEKSSGEIKVHQAKIIQFKSKKNDELSSIVNQYLDSEIPSYFVSAVRFFSQALNIFRETEIVPMIKKNIKHILKKFKKLRDIFPVSEVCVMPFTFILSRSSLLPFQISILNYTSDLVPTNDRASFTTLSLYIPLIISKVEDPDTIKALNMQIDSLLTRPGNIVLFKIYLSALKERAEKVGTDRVKESFISDFVTQWMKNCKYYDCYSMPEIIYEWENLIYQFYELEQLLTLICYQFFKYVPRFFTFFVGLARFVKKYMKLSSPDDQAKIQDILTNSALLNPVRAHALSTLLVNVKGSYKEALTLAAFPYDCPASNEIIDNNPQFKSLLESVKGKI